MIGDELFESVAEYLDDAGPRRRPPVPHPADDAGRAAADAAQARDPRSA